IYQYIDRFVSGYSFFEFPYSFVCGEVCGKGGSGHMVLVFKVKRQLPEEVFSSRDQENIKSLPRKPSGECLPDAARCSRYDRGAAVNSIIECSFHMANPLFFLYLYYNVNFVKYNYILINVEPV